MWQVADCLTNWLADWLSVKALVNKFCRQKKQQEKRNTNNFNEIIRTIKRATPKSKLNSKKKRPTKKLKRIYGPRQVEANGNKTAIEQKHNLWSWDAGSPDSPTITCSGGEASSSLTKSKASLVWHLSVFGHSMKSDPLAVWHCAIFRIAMCGLQKKETKRQKRKQQREKLRRMVSHSSSSQAEPAGSPIPIPILQLACRCRCLRLALAASLIRILTRS